MPNDPLYALTESQYDRMSRVVELAENGHFNQLFPPALMKPIAPVETYVGLTASSITACVGLVPGMGQVNLYRLPVGSGGGAMTPVMTAGYQITAFNLYGSIPTNQLCTLTREAISGSYFINAVQLQPCQEVLTNVVCTAGTLTSTTAYLGLPGGMFLSSSCPTGG